MCICVVYMSAGALGGQRCYMPLELELHTDSCEMPNMGAEHQIQVLCKGSMYFKLLSHLSSLLYTFLY